MNTDKIREAVALMVFTLSSDERQQLAGKALVEALAELDKVPTTGLTVDEVMECFKKAANGKVFGSEYTIREANMLKTLTAAIEAKTNNK